jgi:predicted YcjX-like family ATPase
MQGATIDVVALASVRATREARIQRGGETLPALLGTPAQGIAADGGVFDGNADVATFPGDLPDDAGSLFEGAAFHGAAMGTAAANYGFLNFRPPELPNSDTAPLPHIRLDRALQFLIGDRLA